MSKTRELLTTIYFSFPFSYKKWRSVAKDSKYAKYTFCDIDFIAYLIFIYTL